MEVFFIVVSMNSTFIIKIVQMWIAIHSIRTRKKERAYMCKLRTEKVKEK